MSVSQKKIAEEVEKAFREREKERHRLYRKRFPKKSTESSLKWRAKNAKDFRMIQRMYRYFNRDEIKARNAEWRAKNPNYHKEYSKRWREARPGYGAEYARKRREAGKEKENK